MKEYLKQFKKEIGQSIEELEKDEGQHLHTFFHYQIG